MITKLPDVSRAVARRSAVVAVTGLTLAGTSLALASPAHADASEGWPVADSVSALHVLALLVGAPLLLIVVIAAAVYVPALIRGERIAPGAPPLDNQWLGGPRKNAGELAGPDTDSSEAGGASGRW